MNTILTKFSKDYNRLIIQTILITICIFILGVGASFAQRLFLPNNWEEITTDAYENWYEKIDNHAKEEKLKKLQTKIVATVSQFNDVNIIKLLMFIDGLVAQELQAVSSENDTDGSSQDSDTQDNNETDLPQNIKNIGFIPSYQQGPQVFLAGSQKQILGGFEVTARLEPIILETITLQANKTIGQLIDTRYIVTQEGEIIGQRSSHRGGDSITIENINYQIPQNGKQLYVLADLLPIGYNNPVNEGETFMFDFTISKATGVFSNNTIGQSSFSSDEITITPITMNIKKLNNAYGYNTDGRLTPGENTLLIFEISSEGGNNTQIPYPTQPKLTLEELNIKIDNYTATSNLLSNITLERIDKASQAIQATSMQGNTLTFSTFPDIIGKINTGQTHTYRIIGDITLSSSQQGENIQVTLDNLMDGGILRKEETGQTIYGINTGKVFRIRGDKIIE